jgi:hypothetical protein
MELIVSVPVIVFFSIVGFGICVSCFWENFFEFIHAVTDD